MERNKAMQHFPAQSFIPFMVDAEAGQASDGVSLHQLLQADCTFSCILGEDVLCKTTGRAHCIREEHRPLHNNTFKRDIRKRCYLNDSVLTKMDIRWGCECADLQDRYCLFINKTKMPPISQYENGLQTKKLQWNMLLHFYLHWTCICLSST